MTLRYWISVFGVLSLPVLVASHGRLIEPPSRGTAWRYGFPVPADYDDNGLNCGGREHQLSVNDGKCGLCGDAWELPKPRPHELGGTFGQGVIVRRYSEAEDIDVEIELTASHEGFFEFRVCPHPKNTTQDCLDKGLLMLSNDIDGSRYFPRDGSRTYSMKYHLPEGFTCEHCVFQWKYMTGNNWYVCKNGTIAPECGSQEEFRACADISIGEEYLQGTTRPRPPYVPPPKTPIKPQPTPEGSGFSEGVAWLGGLITAITFKLLTLLQ